MRMPERGHTRVQWTKGNQRGSAKLTVPASIARQISPEALFMVELTDEGILYRYVDGQTPRPPLPRWLAGS